VGHTLPSLFLPFREPHRPDAGEAAAAAWPGGGGARNGAAAGHRRHRVRTRRLRQGSELAGAGGCEACTSRSRDDVRGGGDPEHAPEPRPDTATDAILNPEKRRLEKSCVKSGQNTWLT
jgi:hypothetical protein